MRGRPWRALQGGHTLVSISLLRPERMDVHETTPLADSSSPVNELPTVFQERLVKKTSNRIRRRRVCGAAALCGAALAVAGVASWKHSGQQARLVVADTRLSQFLQLEETRMVKERGRDTYSISANREGHSALSEHTLNMYGFADYIIVEPGALNILTLNCKGLYAESESEALKVSWEVMKLSESSIEPVIELPDEVTATSRELDAGLSLRIKVQPPNAQLKVVATVREQSWSKSAGAMKERLVATVEQHVLVRYVRREIRTLSGIERDRYFKTLHTVMTTPQEEGRKLYGNQFSSLSQLVALHNMNNMAYHGNLFFATSHPAMQLKMDKSLLAVDSGIILPYWDMLQDAHLGHKWTEADVYQNDWFGPVKTTAADNFRLRGRFRDVRAVYDPNSTQFPKSWHNYYGYLGLSELDNNKSPHFQRTNNFCGFSTTVGFSDCMHIENCFLTYERSESMLDFDLCLEHYVHANLHEQHAGMWNCAEDWNDFRRQHVDWLDEDLLSVVAFAQNDFSEKLLKEKKMTCPMKACDIERDDWHSCRCKSAIDGLQEPGDVGSLSHTEVYELVKHFWSGINAGSFLGAQVTTLSEDWGGQVPRNLTFLQISELNRLVLKTGLFPGTFGKMAGGAAANDPLFWVMHQLFDKAFHALRLSPRYNKVFMQWDQEEDNNGKGWNSTTPFKWYDFEPYLGSNKPANMDERLTNKMLWSLLHPRGDSLPYLYDQLNTWGTCDFDPMGE